MLSVHTHSSLSSPLSPRAPATMTSLWDVTSKRNPDQEDILHLNKRYHRQRLVSTKLTRGAMSQKSQTRSVTPTCSSASQCLLSLVHNPVEEIECAQSVKWLDKAAFCADPTAILLQLQMIPFFPSWPAWILVIWMIEQACRHFWPCI